VSQAARAVVVILSLWLWLPAEHVPDMETARLMRTTCLIQGDITPLESSGALVPMTQGNAWSDGHIPPAEVKASSPSRAHVLGG
jgi:hypothetical protein